jgi:hypothetical protein
MTPAQMRMLRPLISDTRNGPLLYPSQEGRSRLQTSYRRNPHFRSYVSFVHRNFVPRKECSLTGKCRAHMLRRQFGLPTNTLHYEGAEGLRGGKSATDAF